MIPEREKITKQTRNKGFMENSLELLESRILVHEKNELAWGEKYESQNYELKCREIKINNLNLEFEKVVKERDELKDKIAKWEDSTKNLDGILNSQMSARDKIGNPEIVYRICRWWISGCSSRYDWQQKLIFQTIRFHEGLFGFGNELKFNLFSVSQMCDKKNSVLFTESECLILSPSFKLLDESQVVLRAPRKDDVYSLDLKNIVPSGGITCLYANATADESKLWHRRLVNQGSLVWLELHSRMVLQKGKTCTLNTVSAPVKECMDLVSHSSVDDMRFPYTTYNGVHRWVFL
ncbi:hypothetical protein Tco_0129075 [Tanacetum coccineum]